MAYEKARIKLLDKNTGQVLKEVDPYTSADAVDYDGSTTVEDRITELILYNDSNDTTIQALKDKDTVFTQNIATINTKNATQDGSINGLLSAVTIINNNIADIRTDNQTQDDNLSALQSSVYTKTESDANYYTKTQSDTNYYTKTASDANYYTKAAADNRYYTKTQIDSTVSTINSTITSTNNTTTTNLTNQIVAKGNNYATTGGTLTAYTVSIAGVGAYSDGLTIVVLPHVDCGDAPTLRINSLSNLQIKNLSGDLLAAGDLKANIPVILVRVGNYFFIRASNRLGTIDKVADPNPGINPTLIASIYHSGSANIARIKNYGQVYVVHDENLYLLDCIKKKETFLGSGYKNKARPYSIDNTLKEWNGYWVYGSRLFNKSTFALVKDFYDSVGYVTSPSYKYGEASNGSSKYRTSNYYQDNYFIQDPVSKNLYLVKAIGNKFNSYYGNYSSYASYSADAEGYRYEIHAVNSDLSTTLRCNIDNNATWGDSEILAIVGDTVYMKGLTFPDQDHNMNYSPGTFTTTGIAVGQTKVGTFSLSSGAYITGLYSAARAPHTGYTDTSSSSLQTSDYFFASAINSPYGNRFITLEYYYDYYKSTSKTNAKTQQNDFVLYDTILGKQVYIYHYYDSGSSSHSVTLDDRDPHYYLAQAGNICNNPDTYISGSGDHGYKVGDSSYSYFQELVSGYGYMTMTSKYGINNAVNQYINTALNTSISESEYYSLAYNHGYRGDPVSTTVGTYYNVVSLSGSTLTISKMYVYSSSYTYSTQNIVVPYIANTSYLPQQDFTQYSYGNAWQIYKF